MPFIYFFKHGFGHVSLYSIVLSIRSSEFVSERFTDKLIST